MSIRASLVSFIIRRTIKKQFATGELEDIRRQVERPTGKLPVGVNVEPVDADGVDAEWVSGSADSNDDGIILYLHGGAYVFGTPESYRNLTSRIARETGMKVLVVDYRLAPEHPFPAAVDDATVAYKWLLAQDHAPERIIVMGDSAGGGLATALMVNLKNLGLSLPGAAVLMSPWCDLSLSGASMQLNEKADVMLSADSLSRFAGDYLVDTNPRAPLASPLFADLSAFPPTLVIVSSSEVLLSDSETLVEKINTTGGQARLSVWKNMPHVFPMLAGTVPEATQAIVEIGSFVRDQFGPKG